MEQVIRFRLNRKPVRLVTDGDRMLLWVLRTELNLTGTKYGCGENQCGACTVLVDEEAVRSCHLPVREVAGKSVLTIEGLSQGRKLHPLQQAFVRHGAIQCGFCSPGMIMNAYGLLLKNGHPGRAEIMEAMEGNLCRCGCYSRILDAIEEVAADKAARETKGGKWK